ncbi:MAG TPA: ATP-binding protein [Kiritimatiellia bacterium]|nr:ATP-binding protein [Kiritimatiellia bacterium]HRZ10919.1 ATP-binding protein [Kiritimatiellia bacterium]HSA18808.1 ATP-binding protein [Kiritimatiellia bacterium]
MKELVVISGKGGTGKTSVTASFAALAGRAVLADCDVDAADLHLLLRPDIRRRESFHAGHAAVIRRASCTGCGACAAACRFDAIRAADGGTFRVDAAGCEGCGVCVRVCPAQAVDFPERVAGEWYVSDTRHGPMVHARLEPGGENSGKLVARVREEARAVGRAAGYDWLLVDGPPGIGCPVIASLTGASRVLVVTEPTLSGAHDLERVLGLARHFNVPALVCVNKWDINPAQTEAIERRVSALGARLAGRIRYDRAATQALLAGRSIVEGPPGEAAADLRALWNAVTNDVRKER